MNLEKGVYLVKAKASLGDDSPSTDILLFHIDPPPGSQPASTTIEFFYYAAIGIALLGVAISTALLSDTRKN